MDRLRALADPEVTAIERSVRGDVASLGRPVAPTAPARAATPNANDRTLYQTRVASFVKNSVDVTAEAVMSADRRYVRVSMTPVFNMATGPEAFPVVANPIIPGKRSP